MKGICLYWEENSNLCSKTRSWQSKFIALLELTAHSGLTSGAFTHWPTGVLEHT